MSGKGLGSRGWRADWWVADYKELAKMDGLPPQDRRVVQKALASLPSRLEDAKQKEMGEMMGKLKEVGRCRPLAERRGLLMFNSLVTVS